MWNTGEVLFNLRSLLEPFSFLFETKEKKWTSFGCCFLYYTLCFVWIGSDQVGFYMLDILKLLVKMVIASIFKLIAKTFATPSICRTFVYIYQFKSLTFLLLKIELLRMILGFSGNIDHTLYVWLYLIHVLYVFFIRATRN